MIEGQEKCILVCMEFLIKEKDGQYFIVFEITKDEYNQYSKVGSLRTLLYTEFKDGHQRYYRKTRKTKNNKVFETQKKCSAEKELAILQKIANSKILKMQEEKK